MSTRILRALGDEKYMSLDGAGQEVEFLLRPFAKAQARKKLRAAESKTQSMDLGHHARIASLLAEGKPSLANYSYEEPSVQADYAKLRPLPAAGPPWGIMSVALALASWQFRRESVLFREAAAGKGLKGLFGGR